MTVFLLMVFLQGSAGGVVAMADPQLHVGADLCASRAEEARGYWRSQGFQDREIVTRCIDSTFYPGLPS